MPLETSDLHPEPVPPAHPPPPDVPDQANGGYPPHNPDLYASIRSNKSQMAAAIRSSNRRVEEKHHPEGHSTLVELLTETSQASVHDILNDGEEDQMFVTGYEKSSVRTFFCYVGFVLTLGIMRLVMHWWQHWLLLATHRKCSLEVAQKVLVHERYQDKHDAYYVKNVITMNAEAISEVTSTSKRLSTNGQCIVKELQQNGITNRVAFFNECSPFQVAFHRTGGRFEHFDSIRFFCCKKLRYIWSPETKRFVKLRGMDVDVPSVTIHHNKGLSTYEQNIRRLVYGSNEILIPLRGVVTLLFLEVLNPFYVFQIFSVILWFAYDYYYYATVIMLMSGFGITVSIIQTQKNQKALYSTVKSSDTATVIRENCESEQIETRLLVPGDVLEIPATGCTMQCDAVLISGNCILDESMLTGESVPVTKTPLPLKRDLNYDNKEHARHTLFCGTKVIQTRYIGSEKVLVKVINTGNITAKGGLIRSILYPPPVDYKFEKDSYKFIMVLAFLAGCGFLYTVTTKILRGVGALKIIVESLDLITIAVPPALPAAMTVGRMYAQKRLQKNNIYCVSPRAINVSGSIDCVCFDKTGTLTEDGLDMWGVLPKDSTNNFQIPLTQINRLPMSEHLLSGMLTCHSITFVNGEMRGDPLDLKIFESTGWILEEANVSDETKYDLLFPTIVKPPRTDSKDNLNLELDVAYDNSNDIGIVREFSFTSALQRMSVITRKLSDNHFNVYCKGSPEMISSLCKPESIPEDFTSKLGFYAQQGYRIIAIAYKSLDKKMNYSKVQKVSREKIESDLQFLGFVILENRLKTDTEEVIESLNAANIRCIMVTGDNLLTAASVAHDCGMVMPGQSLVTVTAHVDKSGSNKYFLSYDITGQPQLTQSDIINDNSVSDEKRNGNYTLMTQSNSVSSCETIDTCTLSTQVSAFEKEAHRITIEGEGEKTIAAGKGGSFRFALTGKTWAIIKEHFVDLVPTIITFGTVFARMSPDQKQHLISDLQNLGYYVAMCGDGANDCGALKAAHTGISLSEAESSVASPFTSKNPTIACVPKVIKEGRAALVTSFGIFKYMAAYSLVQFASVLILYSIDSNLTDLEFLYIDLFIISVTAFFFGKTSSYDGPLVKQTPSNSLISLSPLLSLALHLIVALGFQVAGWYHIQAQPWFVPFNYTDELALNDLGCYENYAVFCISTFQYIILAIVFSKGAPYRKSIISNYGFLVAIIFNTCLSILLTLYPPVWLQDLFQLVVPQDDMIFRAYLVGYGVANFILALFIEKYIIDEIAFKKLRYRWHNIAKSRRKYLMIEHSFRKEVQHPSDFKTVLGWSSEKYDY
ncbi:probable cation-transporting ATPase 13A3 [Culex quinquefasciatus]|uniref:polyamine-transporting ATPase 13A3 n=1 Tax=Culex pipiens pallens TaxID=42434 RepID=UPI0018E3CF2A|nr:probable cation-transporting ATPase 13A3 [Culex quinquefasciatus]XP_038107226.1 probable cation-transporting ATPase 13A3 [Culex quinquefasciatus]XP_038107227.1 probable cation-transporting ATPase 13A3 [Culex quinquefasciatus]XP_039439261.1 polyamine-transporting ATPase 13A3 [Culex pipiens pallens]XP_039439262.1 polyamine-transporting ATPase 13A3 [Culex pipiens pallens]